MEYNWEEPGKSKKSTIWSHFDEEKKHQKAKCKHCQKVVDCRGGSTKGLIVHIRKTKLHENLAAKEENNESNASMIEESPVKSKSSMSSVLDFFPSTLRRTPKQVVSLMAIQGMSYKLIASCQIVHEAFQAFGYDLPKSHTTVSKYIIEYADESKDKLIKLLEADKKNGHRLSISLDEYTSKRNRSYMGINVHSSKLGFANLGLSRMIGSFPSEKLNDHVNTHLAKFGIDIAQDVICVTTDAAAVLVKWSKSIPCLHLKCMCHGLHLAVMDILYVKKKKKVVDPDETQMMAPGHGTQESEFDDKAQYIY